MSWYGRASRASKEEWVRCPLRVQRELPLISSPQDILPATTARLSRGRGERSIYSRQQQYNHCIVKLEEVHAVGSSRQFLELRCSPSAVCVKITHIFTVVGKAICANICCRKQEGATSEEKRKAQNKGLTISEGFQGGDPCMSERGQTDEGSIWRSSVSSCHIAAQRAGKVNAKASIAVASLGYLHRMPDRQNRKGI